MLKTNAIIVQHSFPIYFTTFYYCLYSWDDLHLFFSVWDYPVIGDYCLSLSNSGFSDITLVV